MSLVVEIITIIGFCIDIAGFIYLIYTILSKTRKIEDRLVRLEEIKADVEKTKYTSDIDLQKVLANKISEISIKELLEQAPELIQLSKKLREIQEE